MEPEKLKSTVGTQLAPHRELAGSSGKLAGINGQWPWGQAWADGRGEGMQAPRRAGQPRTSKERAP